MRSSKQRGRARSPWIGIVAASAGLALPAAAQDTYYWNGGLNGTKDTTLGEFATDVGGWIPFSAYQDPSHYYAVGWTGTSSLHDIMLQRSTDLDLLSQAFRDWSTHGPLPHAVVPTPSVTTINPWWNTSATVEVRTTTVNGGPVMLLRKTNAAQPPSTVHLLLVNTPRHFSDYATSQPSSGGVSPGPEWNSGSALFWPEMQAIERGDIVAIVKENVSADFWTALQRTQDVERWLRLTYAQTLLETGQTLGHSYLYGGSWGSQMSGMLALMQPGVYAGAIGFFGPDLGYLIPGADWDRLNLHYLAGMGATPPTRTHSQGLGADFWRLVDSLGIRFDNPASGMHGWDIGAFSQNHRPNELLIKNLNAVVGDEDPGANSYWEREDDAENPNYTRRYLAFTEHGSSHGICVGKNEFSPFDGGEWAALLAATTSGPVANNIPLIPTTPSSGPSITPYPDPYTHTLRRVPIGPGGAGDIGLLTSIDINADTNAVLSVGQGVCPGMFDNLLTGDFDDDGNLEIAFGNFDGCFHVMEVDPTDTTRLTDEWKSPVLGQGLYATAGALDGASGLFVADSLGRIHRLTATGQPDQYSVASSPWASPSTVAGLYAGLVPFMVRGDFHPSTGEELLVLNHYLDWVLISASGSQLARWWRTTDATSPGIPARVEIGDNDSLAELVIPSLDGHLWMLEWDTGTSQLVMTKASEFTGRALYRVEALAESGQAADHFLVLGRDDKLPELTPAQMADRVLLMQSNFPSLATVVDDEPCETNVQTPSIAWLEPYSGANGTFVVGGTPSISPNSSDHLQKFTVDTSVPAVTAGIGVTLPGGILGALETGLVDDEPRLFAALQNGRIYELDENLVFQRFSSAIYSGDPQLPASPTALPWASNRTLALTFASDFLQEPGDAYHRLVFAEQQQPFLQVGSGSSATSLHRIARFGIRIRATYPLQEDAYLASTPPRLEDPIATRFLRRADLDGNGVFENYVAAEAGAVFKDASNNIRLFSNVCGDTGIFLNSNPDEKTTLGGHLYQLFNAQSYAVLDGFVVPHIDDLYDNGQSGEWWYPTHGANFIGGQIANPSQGTYSLYQGSSMKIARLPVDGDLVDCVVTGTYGGDVYAVEPGAQPGSTNPGPDNLASTLRYHSVDLGWTIVGLDVANLDSDPEDEIVVGTWLDDGTYPQWRDGLHPTKHRGHCYVLDANSSTGEFDVIADLNGDDLLGTGNGLSTGILGVKVDNVDGTGPAEIWAGDATGHLYLFQKQSGGGWATIYRSPSLGTYAGLWNQIYPVKSTAGKTTHLVVLTNGYLHAFEVDSDSL